MRQTEFSVKDNIDLEITNLLEILINCGVEQSVINALEIKRRNAFDYVAKDSQRQKGLFIILPVVPVTQTNFSELVAMIKIEDTSFITELDFSSLAHRSTIYQAPYYAIGAFSGEKFRNRAPADIYRGCNPQERESFMSLSELISMAILSPEDDLRDFVYVSMNTWCDMGGGDWRPIALLRRCDALALTAIDPSEKDLRLRCPFVKERLY